MKRAVQRARRESRRGLAALLGVWTIAMVAACGSSSTSSGPETTLQRIERTHVIRIGFFANNPPVSFLDSSGNLTGEGPDELKAVLADAGINAQLQGVSVDFGALIPSLDSGRFDALAGMFILPKRCPNVAFSNPDYQDPFKFVTKAGNPLGLTSFADLKTKNAKFGVTAGGAEQTYAQQAGVPADHIIAFNDLPTMIAGLQAGRVDAIGGDGLGVSDAFKKANDPKLQLVELSVQPPGPNGQPVVSVGGMGFRPADTTLRDAYNKGLADLIAGNKLLAIYQPYGMGASELPPPGMTAAQACGSS